MKKRLIRSGILVIVVSLIMVNMQILFDGSGNTLFPGSDIRASDNYSDDPEYGYYDDWDGDWYEDYYQQDGLTHPYDYMPNRELDNIKCWTANIYIEMSTVQIFERTIPFPIKVGFSVRTNGRRWACLHTRYAIFCDSKRMTECKPVDGENQGPG